MDNDAPWVADFSDGSYYRASPFANDPDSLHIILTVGPGSFGFEMRQYGSRDGSRIRIAVEHFDFCDRNICYQVYRQLINCFTNRTERETLLATLRVGQTL